MLDHASLQSARSVAGRSNLCRICGGTVGQRFRANDFDWFRCENCSTTQKELTYSEYQNLKPSYDPGLFLDSRDRVEVERYLDVDNAFAVLSDAVFRYLDGSRAERVPRSFLDVGCGMGRYLIAAQRLGFDVLGFEPSADHARVATEHFGLPVIKDYFSPEKVGESRFDLIMLSHVIEHIYDPKSFLHGLVQVLKPGGALIVITPNNESLLARTIGKAWPMLKPVDHVSLIGPRAYQHFGLDTWTHVQHSSSEYPFEYVAALLAAVKSAALSSRRDRSTHVGDDMSPAPPPLRSFGVKAKILRYGLTVASAPMYLAAIATGRQACLKSVIIRRSAAAAQGEITG
jgi:SAM-dependent methyltransferase